MAVAGRLSVLFAGFVVAGPGGVFVQLAIAGYSAVGVDLLVASRSMGIENDISSNFKFQ